MACYTPDGSDINKIWKVEDGDLYAPCNTSAPVSMCCAIGPNRTNPDVCISNGFCHNAFFGDKDQTWRESCTDPTWKDPACIKLFVNGTGINATMGIALDDNGSKINDVLITPCDDGSYCAGEDNRECCRQNQGVFVLNGEQVSFNPSISSSSASTLPVSTSTTSASSGTSATPTQDAAASQTTSNETQSSGLSNGAKAGIGVGVGVGVLALLAFAFWFLRRKRKSCIPPRLEPKEETDYQSQPDLLSKPPDPPSREPQHENASELQANTAFKPYRDNERYELGDS